MGAKDWMLIYAENGIRPVLQAAPPLHRAATRELVGRLYPHHRVEEIDDGTLFEHANPPERHVYAGCYSGLTIVCTDDAALDHPSELDQRFLDAARGRALHLHAMHSVVDWFAYAIWDDHGRLRRALSLSPDGGITENIGEPLPFEVPYWAGEHRLELDEGESYSLDFHPLELAEGALRALFGFNFEGFLRDDDPDLERIVLAGFVLGP